MLIAFAGKAGSGKTTAANYLEANYGFTKRAFADPLKEILAILTNKPREYFEYSKSDFICKDKWKISKRELMQKFGTEVMRNEFPNHIPLPQYEGLNTNSIWVLNFVEWYNNQQSNKTGSINVVVHDVRFQDEIDAIHYLGGTVIYITNEDSLEGSMINHSSEMLNKDSASYDFIINNNRTFGIENLYRQIDLCIMKRTCFTFTIDPSKCQMLHLQAEHEILKEDK